MPATGSVGPKGDKAEGNRPGRHCGCGPYRFLGPVECGRRANSLNASQLGARVEPTAGSGSRARRLLIASRCDWPGAGFHGRHTPLVMGSRGERSLLLVVVQRRSAWSGWGLGEGQERPSLSADRNGACFGGGMRLDAEERHSLGDATGARSGPLAKIAVYYTAHLARRGNGLPCNFRN